MKKFTRQQQCTNIQIMQDYLRRHSDIDANSFAFMTYRELCDMYQSVVLYDKIFHIYFNKSYFFHYDIKKLSKSFVN